MTKGHEERVAVVGLGSMGLGVARAIHRCGFDVLGCDPSREARAALSSHGAEVAESAASVDAGTGVVVCVVVNAEQTEDVLFGSGGVADRLAAGAVFVACSTVPPAFASRTEARLDERGLLYLDAPISGGAAKAEAGELSVMASGSAAAFERGAAVLDAMSATVHRLGETAGMGSSMKMINQLLAGVHIAAAGEAIALGAKVGLEPRRVYEVITASAGSSWMFENRVPRILAGRYEPHSAVDIFVKDLGIVLDTARSEGFPTPLSAVAHQLFTMTSSAGMGRWDDSAVAKLYERLSDISLPGDGPGDG